MHYFIPQFHHNTINQDIVLISPRSLRDSVSYILGKVSLYTFLCMQFCLDLQLHAYPRISTHLSMYVVIVISICMYVGISLQNKMRLTFINMTTLWQCFCCCWWWKIIHFCTHENDKRRSNKTNDNWTTATNTNDRRRGEWDACCSCVEEVERTQNNAILKICSTTTTTRD